MGACIESGREPLLVMEHMEHGSLYDLLHNSTLQMEGDVVIPMIKDIVAGERDTGGALGAPTSFFWCGGTLAPPLVLPCRLKRRLLRLPRFPPLPQE